MGVKFYTKGSIIDAAEALVDNVNEYTSAFVAALTPKAKFTRSAIENVIRVERVSDADASMLIFAWGGMAVKNAKLIAGSKIIG